MNKRYKIVRSPNGWWGIYDTLMAHSNESFAPFCSRLEHLGRLADLYSYAADLNLGKTSKAHWSWAKFDYKGE